VVGAALVTVVEVAQAVLELLLDLHYCPELLTPLPLVLAEQVLLLLEPAGLTAQIQFLTL
jgi:hypothetical protein